MNFLWPSIFEQILLARNANFKCYSYLFHLITLLSCTSMASVKFIFFLLNKTNHQFHLHLQIFGYKVNVSLSCYFKTSIF